MKRKPTEEQIIAVLQECGTVIEADAKLRVGHGFTAKWLKKNPWAAPDWFKSKTASKEPGLEIDTKGDGSVVTLRSNSVRTLDGALQVAEVDTSLWEVDHFIVNKWDSGENEMWQVKVWLKKKTPTVQALESVLAKIEKASPIVPLFRKPAKSKARHRALEIDIFDPHFGLQCFQPAADHAWDLDACERTVQWALMSLLEAAGAQAPFDEIVFPFGNDFLHHDNLEHTTTRGTPQPEGMPWHHVYMRGCDLGIWLVEAMAELAPVKVKLIAGNHANQSEFTMAHFLRAYFRRNKNVEVDASPTPYKFWKFGCNLIGFAHGRSEKAANLAALMANETRLNGWQDARWCEWHLGDQHRKATAKPSSFEEQGVSIEYLTCLTPANAWHKAKTFNFSKRGAYAFVYDRAAGPLARYQVNLDSYTGKPLGAA